MHREPKLEPNSWAANRALPPDPTKKGQVLAQRCSPGGRWPPLGNSSPSCVQWGSRGNSRPLSSGWRPGSRGRHSCLHLQWKRREIHAQPRRRAQRRCSPEERAGRHLTCSDRCTITYTSISAPRTRTARISMATYQYFSLSC